MRRSSVVLAIVGVLLVAAAAVVRFAIVPGATKLPSDLDTTVHYAGKGTLLNSNAILAGDMANAIAKDVDVTIDRHVFVSRTEGETAIVHDESTLKAGPVTRNDNHVYAIDRATRKATTPPAGEKVDNHSELTIALPLDPAADNSYKLFDTPTQTATTLTYAGEENRGGRDTLHYTAEASGPVKSPELAATLPPVLPKSVATGLLPSLPADVQAKLAPLAAQLPDLIPLSYAVTSKYGLWADAMLGAPVQSSLQRTIVASASVGTQTYELLPVLDINVTQTPASVQEAADRADSLGSKLSLLGTWLPVGMAVLGVLLIALAIVRRKRPATAAPAESAD